MNTNIKYLQQLETDLKDAAAREAAGSDLAVGRRRGGQIWMKVAGVAAAFIVVAGAIGFVAGGGKEAAMQGSADKFQKVGDAVASDGGADEQEVRGSGTGDEAPAIRRPLMREQRWAGPSTTLTMTSLWTVSAPAASSRTSRRSCATGASASSFRTTGSATPSAT